MQLWRSLLFVPGNRERMLDRAATLGADVVIIDLEDAVVQGEKKSARRLARGRVKDLARAGQAVFVRVNAIAGGLSRDDLLAVVRPGLAGVVLPKAERPQDVRDLDVLLREAEVTNKMRPGTISVLPLIESPRALLRCEEIMLASDRIVGLSLGGEDYSAAMGIARDAAGTGLVHARYTVATVAAAYGLVAIDTPYADFGDAKGLVAETGFAKAIGFRGKYVIHPDQVAPVNRVFTPSRADIAGATRVLAVAGGGAGSVQLNGSMVDAPVIARAERLLEMAAAIKARRRKAQP